MAVRKTIDFGPIEQAVGRLTRAVVYVGIPAEGAARPVKEGEKRGPISNAALGYIHETGLPEKNIPARPFLVPGVENAKPKIVEQMKAAAKAGLNGNTADMDNALNAVGLIAQIAVQAKITSGPFAPNTPATIKRKGSDRPLIDTGIMRRAVTYIVKRG